MILILQNAGDKSAGWLCWQLQQRGLAPVAITAEEILTSKKFELTLIDGQYESHIILQNGINIHSSEITAVINRIHTLPPVLMGVFRQEDSGYVHQEWLAMLVSWLHSLQQVVLFNQVNPVTLAGNQFTEQEWRLMAVRAGFTIYEQGDIPCHPCTIISYDNQLFVDPLHPEIPETIRQHAAQLHHTTGLQMMGIRLIRTAQEWYFAGATSFPSLLDTGTTLPDYLARTITRKQTPVLQPH